jgi:hypothetical protein
VTLLPAGIKVTGVNYEDKVGQRSAALFLAPRRATSGDLVKVTQLNSGEKLAPFFHRELTDLALGSTGVAYKDNRTTSRYADACTAITGTGSTPRDIL